MSEDKEFRERFMREKGEPDFSSIAMLYGIIGMEEDLEDAIRQVYLAGIAAGRKSP